MPNDVDRQKVECMKGRRQRGEQGLHVRVSYFHEQMYYSSSSVSCDGVTVANYVLPRCTAGHVVNCKLNRFIANQKTVPHENKQAAITCLLVECDGKSTNSLLTLGYIAAR